MMTAPLEAERSWRTSCGPEILVHEGEGALGLSPLAIRVRSLQLQGMLVRAPVLSNPPASRSQSRGAGSIHTSLFTRPQYPHLWNGMVTGLAYWVTVWSRR